MGASVPGAVQGRGSGLGSGLGSASALVLCRGCLGIRWDAPVAEARPPSVLGTVLPAAAQALLATEWLWAPRACPQHFSLWALQATTLWPLPFPSLAPCTRHVLGPSVLSPLCLVWPCPCGQLPEGDSSLVWSTFCLSDLWRIRVRPEASPVCCPGLLHQ